MQTSESEEGKNPIELLPDFVLAMIMYMLTTSDLLNAMVLTCFHDPLPHFSKIVCKRWLFITQHEYVVWENRFVCIHMQPERFQKMLCSFSKKNFFVQHLEATGNNIGDAGAESISRALKTNTSLKSLDISSVLFCSSIFHTQQLITLELLVLRAFREHSNQTLHSHHLIFAVCYFVKTPFTLNR